MHSPSQAVWPDVEIKSSQSFPKVAQKGATVILTLLRRDLFQIGPKSHQIFRQLWKKACGQDLSKIAQSGHTGQKPALDAMTCSTVLQLKWRPYCHSF